MVPANPLSKLGKVECDGEILKLHLLYKTSGDGKDDFLHELL